MPSAKTEPDVIDGWRDGHGPGPSLVLFAGVVLMWVGTFNLIYGAAALANSHALSLDPHFVFGTLHTWGWVTLVVAVLQLVAGYTVLMGNQLARWFGVAVIGLNAIAQMFFIPASPWYSLVIIALDIVALYGLCVYGGPAKAHAA